MTCVSETCNDRRAIQEIHRDIQISSREFIKNLLHLKCKVIRLVQNQMKGSNEKLRIHYQKGNQTSSDVSAMTSYFRNSTTRTTATDAFANSTKFSSTSVHGDFPYIKHVPGVPHLPPGRAINNTSWRNSISRRIPHCSNILLAALVLGILVWMSLLYGALLGASLCGHGRSSFPLMSFAHSQTRNILF